MVPKREKSEIEIIIQDEINDFKKIEITEDIEKEIDFLESLLDYFRNLEDDMLYKSENTFDEYKMRYVLDNLPPTISEKIKTCIKRDKETQKNIKIKKVETEKERILNSIKEHNVNKKARYHGHNRPFIIYDLKKKFENNEKNNRIRKNNMNKYSEIIDYIEKNYVYRYGMSQSNGSYYMNDYEKIPNPSAFSDEYEKYEQKMREDRQNERVKTCHELLAYCNFSNEMTKKLQNFLDLLKKNAIINQLIECTSDLSLNNDYTETKKIINKVFNELLEANKSTNSIIFKIEKEIDLSAIYNEKKEEINKNKLEEKEKKQKEKKLEESNISYYAVSANEEYKKTFIDEYINRKYRENPKNEAQYIEIREEAISNLNNELRYLNDELRKYFISYLEKELVDFILQNYKITDQKDIDYLINDAMLSPQERYINDMINKKRFPKGTKVEDLTIRDFELIEKNKDRYKDDACDKIIQELSKKRKQIKETDFTYIYKIEDIKLMLENIKKENNNFEEAKKHFSR